jgi:enoyl-CoA hydratase/carnithine racemase
MLTSTQTVNLEYLDGQAIAVIALNDPDHANAMSPEMGDAFSAAIRDIQANTAARVVIIRGAGKHFRSAAIAIC